MLKLRKSIINVKDTYNVCVRIYFALLDHICILASSGIITENKFFQIKKIWKIFFCLFHD